MENRELIVKKIGLLQRLIHLYQRWIQKTKLGKGLIIVHHTATPRDGTKFEAVNRNHQRVGYRTSKLGFNMAYNALITSDGKKHIARGIDEQGLATSGHRGFHYDLCLTGNFNIERITRAQEETLKKTLDDFVARGYRVGYHQLYNATDCPGLNLIAYLKANYIVEK